MKQHRTLFVVPLVLVAMALTPLWARFVRWPQATDGKVGLQPLRTLVQGASSTLMPDGRWLVLGGESPNGPISTASMRNPTTGVVTSLASGLLQPRAWHTATLLPNGTVLIFGGVGAGGHIVESAEIFNPATMQFQATPTPGLTVRSHHTATLLTDGRVLLAGGISETGETLGSADLWDPSNSTGTSVSPGLLIPRHDQTATLLANGDVLLWGGTDRNGSPIQFGEIFDLAALSFRLETVQPQAQSTSGAPVLEASIPTNGSDNIAVDALIGLRFSEPLLVTTVNTTTVTLASPAGPVPANIIPAEGGMLAFVTPQSTLLPGTAYTVTLNGLTDLNGNALTQTLVSFTTAGKAPESADIPFGAGGVEGPSSATQNTNAQKLPALQAAAGVTALAGQSLQLSGLPLDGIVIEDESQNVKAQTDRTGRFLLQPLTAGHHVLYLDARPASGRGQTYGTYEIGIDIVAGKTNVLSYTIWMTALDMAHAVTIPSPTTSNLVITSPLLPGLELHIPKGTLIIDHEGKVVRQVSITPVPLGQPPFPLPEVQVPIYFTIQPGAAYLQSASSSSSSYSSPSSSSSTSSSSTSSASTSGSGSWSVGAQLYYPNTYNALPGTRINFWNYDPDQQGWYIYGQGTVTPDKTEIVPDPGVMIYEFTGAMVASPSYAPSTSRPAGGPSGNDPPALADPPPSVPDPDGEPVDLSTGLFTYNKTDLTVSDVIPVSLTRTYRPADTLSRAFGIGATHAFDIFLEGDSTNYTYAELIMPDGGRIRYNRTSSGTSYTDAVYVASDAPTGFYGSVMVYNGTGWNITLKNGTVYSFLDGFGATRPQQAALIGITDRNGNTVSLTRDSNDNLTQITTSNSRWIQFTYDGSYRIIQAQDNIGRTVSYTYDGGGRLATVTDANGGVTSYTYDSSNNMLTITDPRGIVYLTNQYDSNNRVIKQTLADGSTYQFAYTLTTNSSQTHFTVTGGGYSGGGPGVAILAWRGCSGCEEAYTPEVSQVNVTNQRGYVRQVVFGSNGYMSSDTRAYGRPEQETTTYSYYPDNLLESVTDPLGRTMAYVYDINANSTEVTRLSGTSGAVSTTATYDSTFSDLTSATDPLNHTTSYSYDSDGNLTSVADPLGHHSSFTYNSSGQPLSATDALGHTTTFAYDNGDLVSTTDPLSRTSTRFVDSAGRLIASTNPLGQSTLYAYNMLNEVTSTTDALGNTTSFTHDGNGNLLTVTDANSHATTYTYDSMDRLSTRTDPLSHSENYSYDAAGNLAQFTDRRGKVTTYSYDALNRRTLAGFGLQGGSYESTIGYSYDVGNRLSNVVDSGTGTITPVFDNLDRLTEEVSPQGAVTYAYDLAGRRTSMTAAGQSAVSYFYDNANRLTEIAQGTSTRIPMAYDAANRRTLLTLANGVTVSYSYNSASQLTGMTYELGLTTLGTLTYGYDAAGRRVSMGGSYAQTGLPAGVSTASYNADNQVTQWGSASLYYDGNGNMTSDGTNAYTWNARNQLASMNFTSDSFQYDGYGRRVGRTISGTTTNYLYNGSNIVQEVMSGTPTANLLSGGIDEVFQRTDSSGAANFITDGLGSTLALTDSSGSTMASYEYDPFGTTTVTNGSSANSYQYTGRENDGTGLYFNRARYYSPALQRLISEDPMGISAGINLYAYVADNPIQFADPLGLDKKQPAAAPSAPLLGYARPPWLPGNQYNKFNTGPSSGPYRPNAGPEAPEGPINPTELPPAFEPPPPGGLPQTIEPTPFLIPAPATPEAHPFLTGAGDVILAIIDALTEISDPILVTRQPCNCY